MVFAQAIDAKGGHGAMGIPLHESRQAGDLAIPSKERSYLSLNAEPMGKSLIIAIIASLVSTLVSAKRYTQRRAKAQPRN
jgi:hypothetical protein